MLNSKLCLNFCIVCHCNWLYTVFCFPSGALFNQLTLYVTSWRRKYLHKKGNRVKVLEVCIISLITSVISFGLPLLRSCSPCPDSETNPGIECPRPPGMDGDFVNFYCANDREYNDLATIFFNTQDDAIRNLFSAKTFHEYSAQSLLTFLVLCFIMLFMLTFVCISSFPDVAVKQFAQLPHNS
ncbi:unnamed protein product, partial [Musa textilis]